MDLAFESKQIREICESTSAAEASFGEEVARSLRGRLSDIEAATSIRDIVLGNLRPAEQGSTDSMIIDISVEYCLIFCSNHARNPGTEQTAIDWERVSRVKIQAIEKRP